MSKNEKKIYGMELILDIDGCDLKIIKSKEKILEFSKKICKIIQMKPYKKPLIARFGFGKDFTAGYSLVQLIETSSITGHFSELWRSCFINIFSCQKFDTKKVIDFTKKFFRAKKLKRRIIIR